MIILCPFYRDLNKHEKRITPGKVDTSFKYKRALSILEESFNNHHSNLDKFIVCTDNTTTLDTFKTTLKHRIDCKGKNLMESLIHSNTSIVEQYDNAKLILCGSDHIILKNLSPLFNDSFDIAIMMRKNTNKVNNAVVLVNSTPNNTASIQEFFQLRQRIYYELKERTRDWGGDQESLRIALQQIGLLPENHTNTSPNGPRLHTALGITFKFFDYDSNGIYGVNKQRIKMLRDMVPLPNRLPNLFNRNTLFLDFKGERKQFYERVYKDIVDSQQPYYFKR
jgi:hypothetical protein